MLDSYYNQTKFTHPNLYADYLDILIKNALKILQESQRYSLEPLGDYQGEGMVSSDTGDWIAWDDVLKAVKILQDKEK